jgi:2-succinyl-5-enolpyruvyl-6-hydroxy-3-cyclohexene-1-carboxylate synthase
MAQVLVDEMIRNGVRILVLAPGSRSSALAIAAAERREISLHVEIDERSAGFFALGVGKAVRSPAVVVTTSGTAAGNLYPALLEADASHTPLLALTADRPPELRSVGANQTIDQIKLFGDRVRWFCELAVAEDRPGVVDYWRSTVCRAVAEARGRRGPPGPVHLNLPFREPLVPLADDGRGRASPFTQSLAGRPGGGPWTTFDQATPPWLTMSGEGSVSKRVLVWIGDRGDRSLARELMERGCVVVAEAHSGARAPGTITTAHHLLSHPGFLQEAMPDVVYRIGRVGLSRNLSALAGVEQRVIDPWDWSDPDRSAVSLQTLLVLPPADRDQTWIDLWQHAEKTARRALDSVLDAIDTPTEPRAARDAARATPGGGWLVVGSSMPVRDLDWFMETSEIRVLSNRGASGIDGFVSTALGAAAGGEPTLALTGDLSFLHDQNGLLVQPRPACVFVVVNNDGGGIFSFLPQARFPHHFERLFGTPHGRSLERLAAFYELGYEAIEKAGGLEPAVERALAAGGVHLLEVRTDREENLELHRTVTATVHRDLDRLFQS